MLGLNVEMKNTRIEVDQDLHKQITVSRDFRAGTSPSLVQALKTDRVATFALSMTDGDCADSLESSPQNGKLMLSFGQLVL